MAVLIVTEEEERRAFREKLRSIQFGAGTKPSSSRRYDSEALKEAGLDANRELEMEKTNGVGFMRRDRSGQFYRKDKITGDYIKAEAKDIDRILGGGRSVDERRRSFGLGRNTGSGSKSSGS